MDRFKFRVFCKSRGDYVEKMLDLTIYYDGRLVEYDGLEQDMDNHIIEQCTGLKDKNGNLIYEGDIVIEGGNKGVVKYGTLNCSCCDGVYGWYFDGLNGQTDIRCYEFCEVIGNIHEQKD